MNDGAEAAARLLAIANDINERARMVAGCERKRIVKNENGERM
jgi:hypothetical protein